jgi:hypothetical protein
MEGTQSSDAAPAPTAVAAHDAAAVAVVPKKQSYLEMMGLADMEVPKGRKKKQTLEKGLLKPTIEGTVGIMKPDEGSKVSVGRARTCYSLLLRSVWV